MNEIQLQSYYEHMKALNEMAKYCPKYCARLVEIREAIEQIKLNYD